MNCPPYPHKPIMTIWIFPAKKRTKLFHANGDTKKNYEINNKSILTILQTRIYQTNELKYIQNDQKSCRFYLFDFQIDNNKNIWFIIRQFGIYLQLFGAISIRLLISNNVSTLWNFIMGLAFSEVALNMQFQ